MVESYPVLSLLAALLLAVPAGLNPYLPLFIAAAAARVGFFTPLFPLGFIGESWFLALVALLFLANVFTDKAFLPGESLLAEDRRSLRARVGVVHDLGQMLLGPLVAGLLMGATSRFFPPSWPLAAPMIGALLAVLLYVGKRALRRRWAGRWGLFGNALMSVLEDGLVLVLCLGGMFLLR